MRGMATPERLAYWQRIPKVSLHCHLEGTVAPATVIELAREHGIELEGDPTPETLYRFPGFLAFLRCFVNVGRTLATPAAYGRIAREFVAYAQAHAIRRAELFISPAGWRRLHPGLDLRAAAEAIARELAAGAAAGVETVLIVDLVRNFGPEDAQDTVELIAGWQDLGVVGVGLGGDEAAWPAALFTGAFALARRRGLHCVAHAGEAAGAQSVHDAVTLLGAERIGHGVRAIEDPAVVELLARRGVALEQSPTSNVRTGAWPDPMTHPIAALSAAGIAVAVDADDPPMFETTISHELALLEERFGTAFAAARLRDAIGASFAEPARKRELLRELDI